MFDIFSKFSLGFNPANQIVYYRQQKHSIRFLTFKDQYEINIFNILCLRFKCQNKASPNAFENLFALKTKKNKYQLKCTVAQRLHLNIASHFFLKKYFSVTKNCHKLLPRIYNCRELLPDTYNCRELLSELLRDSYNCRKLF